MSGELRSRTYEWAPPDFSSPALARMSGLELFEGMRDGTIPPPPIAVTVGWTIDKVERGLIRLRLEPQEFLFHGGGVLHGGVISTLLDSAMASAILTMFDRGRTCTTLQLSVNTIRGIKPGGGPLFAEGRVDHVAAKAAAANGTLTDGEGRVLAKAMTSCVVFDIPLA
jgi:uncharacterized protein (TIGR00369 family)